MDGQSLLCSSMRFIVVSWSFCRSDPLIVSLLWASIVILMIFVYWESMHPYPIFNIFLLRYRNFALDCIMAALSSMILVGAMCASLFRIFRFPRFLFGLSLLVLFLLSCRLPHSLLSTTLLQHSLSLPLVFGFLLFRAYMPIYMQYCKGYSALEIGVRMLPLVAALAVAAVAVGMAESKWGIFRFVPSPAAALSVIACGLLTMLDAETRYGELLGFLMIMGSYLLLHFRVSPSSSFFSLLLFSSLLFFEFSSPISAFGVGMTLPIIPVIAQQGTPRADLPNALSGVSFIRSIGGAIGVAIMAAVFNNEVPRHATDYVNAHAKLVRCVCSHLFHSWFSLYPRFVFVFLVDSKGLLLPDQWNRSGTSSGLSHDCSCKGGCRAKCHRSFTW